MENVALILQSKNNTISVVFGLIVGIVANPVGAEAVSQIPEQLRVEPELGPRSDILPSGDSREVRNRTQGWKIERPAPPIIVERKVSQGRPGKHGVSSSFGWRSDPLNGASRRHLGIDLPGKTGAGVFATGPGSVVRAGWARGYGKVVEVEHPGGVRTLFAHLSRTLVRRGSRVARGQLIGFVGSTGRSTGPHLHYEVRVNGVPANPLRFIGQTSSSDPQTPSPQINLITPQAPVASRHGWAEQDERHLPAVRLK